MLRSQSRSWIVALLAAAGSLALCGRAIAQEPPSTEPTEESADKVERPAAETKAPEAAPKTLKENPVAHAWSRLPRASDVQKVFIIKNVKVRPLAEVLAVFPATITLSYYAETTALGISAPPAVMAAIEETIKRLDVPPPPFKSIELTGYILEALAHPADTPSMPPELESVVAQLKRTFSYLAYRLADTLIARARDSSGLDADVTSAGDFLEVGRLTYLLSVRRAFITEGTGGAVVHLDRMSFRAHNPKMMGPARFSGDVDIRAGQRVVVGNTGLGSGNAIILVLSARVVD
jgi:hypothetical protein